MNIREELYVSGSGLTVRHVEQHRTGRRVAVLDPARRTRAAVVQMLLSGKTPRDIARLLDLPVHVICALGIAGLKNRRNLRGAV